MNRLAARGFSLIELMITIVLGALVILVLINVFGAALVTARQNDATGHIQQNARFAVQRLDRDLRSAGFRHCVGFPGETGAPISGPTVMNSSNAGDFSTFAASGAPFALPVAAFVSVHRCSPWSCLPALPATVGGAPLPALGVTPPAAGSRARDSDVIIARHFAGEGVPLAAPMASTSSPVPIDGAAAAAAGWALTPGQQFLVADCRGGDLFTADGLSAVGLGHASQNRSRDLSRAYAPGDFTRVYRYPQDLVERAYFVGYSADPATAGKVVGGLWSNDEAGGMSEILPGVDRLRVDVLATTGGNFGVMTPPVIGGGVDARAQRRYDIALLVNGVTESALQSQPFLFTGVTQAVSTLPTGTDRRPRREVAWSVDLRNF